MSKQGLQEPAGQHETKRRAEDSSPVTEHESPSTLPASTEKTSHTIDAQAAALQRFSASKQHHLLTHLNRTQGNREVQRLAQAMQRPKPSAPVARPAATNKGTFAP